MSQYKLPQNGQAKVASVWLFFLLLIAIFPLSKSLSFNFTAQYQYFQFLSGDVIYPIIILSTFYGLFCIAMLLMYLSRANMLAKLYKGDYYAAWILEGNQWTEFREMEKNNQTKGMTGFALIISLILVAVGVIIFFSSKKLSSPLFLIIIFGVAALIFLTAVIRIYIVNKNLKTDHGIIYLNDSCLVYNNTMHQFKGFGTRFEDMAVLIEESKAYLTLVYSVYQRHGARSYQTVQVPIPFQEIENFKLIIEAVKSKIPANLKIDLTVNKINLTAIPNSKKYYLGALITSIVISSFASYSWVESSVNEYKKNKAEYEARHKREADEIIKRNEDIYNSLPESAKDYHKIDGIIWENLIDDYKDNFAINEILTDGSSILAYDDHEVTTTINMFSADGKLVWKKKVSTEIDKKYFIPMKVIDFGKNIAFISTFPIWNINDKVEIKITLIDKNSDILSDKLVTIGSVGYLENPEIAKYNNNSIIYYAFNENSNKPFYTIIDLSGNILSRGELPNESKSEGLYERDISSKIFLLDDKMGQIHKDKFYVYDNKSVLSESFLLPEHSDKYYNVLSTKNSYLFFCNAIGLVENEDDFYYENQIRQDSLQIDIFNATGKFSNFVKQKIRAISEPSIYKISNDKILIVAGSKTYKYEYNKLLIAVYDLKSNTISERVLGVYKSPIKLLSSNFSNGYLYLCTANNSNKNKSNIEVNYLKIKV